MSVQANITSQIVVTETLDLPGANRPQVRHDAFKTTATLNADTTPAATQIVSFIVTLSAGAATIDLSALPGTQGTLDGTGLKIRSFWLKNIKEDGTANTGAVTITPGASNGYNIFGASDGKATADLGGTIHWTPAASQTIASGDRNIDLAGTGTDEFQCVILLG